MKSSLFCILFVWLSLPCFSQTAKLTSFRQINPTTVELIRSDNNRITLDFYGDHIFRLFEDVNGGFVKDPESKPAAKILVDQPRQSVSSLKVSDDGTSILVATPEITVALDKESATFRIIRVKDGRTVVEQSAPVQFGKKNTVLTLKEQAGEYFYGGGVQNGRFSHRAQVISIENENSWTDGGVASPAPYYWSTGGYGFMWFTFKKGKYDFGAAKAGEVKLSHDTDYMDVFFMINDGAVALLNDYYQLTGHPVLLPKFGFYEGHLNAYNRDYWKAVDEGGVPFEDGKRYKESQKDKSGIRESLNGEKNNYQFSARAVIDRYKAHDMPFGWILPNDGYGAGYGQTETLDGNIENLKSLGDYARKNGVEIGLWTQSDLHPKAGVSPLLQRDIIKEVRDAGVRVLKTDVAWVGDGYSFGLNGISDVAGIMPYYGSNSRPFIITLDGWAGTQRYAGVWSGDQTGGVWEYIRFHIPTYIGSGLSGIPNITSDMDGIFGGKNGVINARDFEWKAFTPMQLNMDGWGSNEKYPQALGEPYTSINRWYLKLKAQMMPYTYSIAREAVDGKPMMRAMFLDDPNDYTHGIATQYQYMYGPSLLVAPIYQATAAKANGDDLRHGIYLPAGKWIDYFSGETYEGNRILNGFDAPLWKLPLFVRQGAIIPMTLSNHNVTEIPGDLRMYEIYPGDENVFTEYDDDGRTEAYRHGACSETCIQSVASNGDLTVTIDPTAGSFDGFVKEKQTVVKVIADDAFGKITATIGGKRITLRKAQSADDYEQSDNVYFYMPAIAGDPVQMDKQALCIKLEKCDVTQSEVMIRIKGYSFTEKNHWMQSTGALTAPAQATVTEEHRTAYTLTPSWQPVNGADYYEILFQDMLYSTIPGDSLLFENLKAESDYSFKVRAVNRSGCSDWSAISGRTLSDPLQFAIRGLSGVSSAPDEEDQGVDKLFDYIPSKIWHTAYGKKAAPYDLTVNLNSVNTIDKLQYLPRENGGNGTILEGSIFYGNDGENWTKAGDFQWEKSGEMKEFVFKEKPTVRFIRISVAKGVGDYGSGRELYVFKVAGTPSFRAGDINNDRLVDMNDFTSYLNYTGLRHGDSDFEGYISNGDLNRNGRIDAYDISVLTTQLRGGAQIDTAAVAGSITLTSDKKSYQTGEMIEIRVTAEDPQHINALGFALPYKQEDMNFVGLKDISMKEMENMTNDRLHTDGEKVLYPTFVNIGDKERLNGSGKVALFTIRFKANRKVELQLKPAEGILVGTNLKVRHLTF